MLFMALSGKRLAKLGCALSSAAGTWLFWQSSNGKFDCLGFHSFFHGIVGNYAFHFLHHSGYTKSRNVTITGVGKLVGRNGF